MVNSSIDETCALWRVDVRCRIWQFVRLVANAVSQDDHAAAELALFEQLQMQPHTDREERFPPPTTTGQTIIWNSSTRLP